MAAGAGARPEPVTRLRCGKVVTCVSASPLGSPLATGHPDNVVRIWDSRGRGGAAGGAGEAAAVGLRSSLGGCGAWVSAVAFCPDSGPYVAAATHGGAALLWDVRAPASPLHSLAKHGDKALALAWAPQGGRGARAEHGGLVLSAGADCKVRATTTGVGGVGGS